jgi:hypothetical protein
MTIIKELYNPLTPKYNELKKIILSPDFKWQNLGLIIHPSSSYHPLDVNDPEVNSFDLFVHPFLHRPIQSCMYSEKACEHLDLVSRVITEILYTNKIYSAVYYRIAVNLVLDTEGRSPRHVDHQFPHKNLIVYLNDFDDGETIVYDENGVEHKSSPKEDLPIVFDGDYHHCHRASKKGKRYCF